MIEIVLNFTKRKQKKFILIILNNMNQVIYIEVETKKYPLIITPCIDKEDTEA
jgi:hypothetical protein